MVVVVDRYPAVKVPVVDLNAERIAALTAHISANCLSMSRFFGCG